MDEAWERAVEAALGGQAHLSSSAQPPRTLTLDGSVKCLHGRLPPPEILERYQSLEHLSIANIGVSSLEKFPRLRNLQRLILSDNRIAGGLECLVEAGLDSLRVLDLSNNRIQFLEDLAPLARLRLTSLDLYECPVTKIKDYRSRVFWMIRTLKDLDKMDADENERPESDEEEDEEEEEEDEDEDEEEDPGSGEVDGGDRVERLANGVANNGVGGIIDVDEEEESDAEEDTETGRGSNVNGYHASNGFRVALVRSASDDGEEDEEEDIDEEDDAEDNDEDLGEEIDAEEGEDEDVVEVLDIGDSDEDEDDDGVEEDGEEELDEEDREEYEDGERDEDVEDEEDDGEPQCSRRLTSVEGEIDGHEQGEERDEDKDENGEIGEEDEPEVDDDRYSEEGDGEDEDEDDDAAGEYLVQPIAQPAYETVGSDDEDEVDDDDDEDVTWLDQPSSSSQAKKRKRDSVEDILDDDSVEDMNSPKHR